MKNSQECSIENKSSTSSGFLHLYLHE